MIAQALRKIYILDTNVLVHDPLALNQFDEHDVVLPIAVLEEMDRLKRGFDEAARNVREVSRQLDELSWACSDLAEGCPLPDGGRLFFEIGGETATELLPPSFQKSGGDNRILAVTLAIQKKHPSRQVFLVSKDINLRIKARALGINAEDYRSDRVVDDIDLLGTGVIALDDATWNAMGETMAIEEVRLSEHEHGSLYRVDWPDTLALPCLNEFVLLPGDEKSALRCVGHDGRRVSLQEVRSFRGPRGAIWGVRARNFEQNMAMNLLMDRELDLVNILGMAGSGKTLMALACGLQQALDLGIYEKILVTRATVPMGQDIGFLPGSEKEKLEPWMGAISDNLKMLLGEEFTGLANVAQYKIEIAALSFARGRSFSKTWLIVDEAQNLTPHQMKTIITRMGEGSKIVILGNNSQIDTPYLTAHTNGLSMAVMRFTDWGHAGHITLRASERSRLAAYAVEVL